MQVSVKTLRACLRVGQVGKSWQQQAELEQTHHQLYELCRTGQCKPIVASPAPRPVTHLQHSTIDLTYRMVKQDSTK